MSPVRAALEKLRRITSSRKSDSSLEKLLQGYVEQFVASNRAAKVLANDLRVIGIGLRPLIDHFGFFTRCIRTKSSDLMDYGYESKGSSASLRDKDWHAKVFSKTGYPAVVLYEAVKHRGRSLCGIGQWIERFGETVPHHIGVKVDNLENAVFFLEKQGIAFSPEKAGSQESKLRQVFTMPEMKDGRPFTVLELTERHSGYEGFMADHLHCLMKVFFHPQEF